MRRFLPVFLSAVVAISLATAPAALAHDDPDRQLADLNLRVEQAPDSAALRLERAELHRFRRDWAAGVADLQAASRLDPSMDAVDLAMARLLLDADNLAAALDAADRFLQRNPDNIGGHLARARILLRSGRGLEAAQAFTRAIETDRRLRSDAAAPSPTEPGSGIQPDDYLQRARALAGAGRIDEALHGLDEGLAALGQPVTLQLLAVELEEERGHTADALRRLASMEARARRKETWMARRGDVLAKAGRPAEAAVAWQQARRTIAALPPRLRDSDATSALDAELRLKLETTSPNAPNASVAPTAGETAAPTLIARTASEGGTP